VYRTVFCTLTWQDHPDSNPFFLSGHLPTFTTPTLHLETILFPLSNNMRKIFLLFLTLLLSACNDHEATSPYHAIDISWQHAHADFRLTDSNRAPRMLSDFKGKVVVLFFGYTHCPEVCPTTLADLAQTMRLLGNDANRVQVLFVTLDPDRDKPELLTNFVSSFNPAFLALYGDPQSTAQAASTFGVNYTKRPDQHGGYTLDHTDGIFLLGLRGTPLLLAPYGQPAEQMAHDIRLLLSIGR
jgi:protein SCO1/2